MREDLPESFELPVLDDSMAPQIEAGYTARFSRVHAPVPGKPVLLRDRDGNYMIRNYRPRRPGHWVDEATNEAYSELDSIADGLVVVAVMKGLDWA